MGGDVEERKNLRSSGCDGRRRVGSLVCGRLNVVQTLWFEEHACAARIGKHGTAGSAPARGRRRLMPMHVLRGHVVANNDAAQLIVLAGLLGTAQAEPIEIGGQSLRFAG
jgi:hypothetical protein